ncbi:exosome complex exonuclease RRP6 [Plasmodium gonderi]|uniref:Exosome complex exonuclease RRP6 n=1 Tax=Plasmodium gonderi TaxID=77519 RepID=A0A1Y1JJZ5_PLAGO|nr:exosome complex exonuclease RRP6 [Plasmodium gonderi]GAW82590.1 exosome complex exonuclease RRP6 [Plasmodium gonderi]
MDHCSKKIEELIKGNIDKGEIESNEKSYLIKGLVKNIIEIVKLTNRLSTNCLYGNKLDAMSNDAEIKNLQNDLLKAAYDLIFYSSSEKTKSMITCDCENGYLTIANNYHIISATLDEIFTRSKECFRFFNIQNKDTPILTCKNSKILDKHFTRNSSQNNEQNYCTNFLSSNVDEQVQEKEEKKKQKIDRDFEEETQKGGRYTRSSNNSNVTPFIEDKKEQPTMFINDQNSIIITPHTRIGEAEEKEVEEEEERNAFQLIVNAKILKVQSESEDSSLDKKCQSNKGKKVKKEIDKTYKKKSTPNAKIKNEENIEIRNDMNPYKYISNKTQNSWLHLINNYATVFIPRVIFKYNKLTDLEHDLVEAVKLQEGYIKKKQKVLNLWSRFNCGKLRHVSCEEIIRDIFQEDPLGYDSPSEEEEQTAQMGQSGQMGNPGKSRDQSESKNRDTNNGSLGEMARPYSPCSSSDCVVENYSSPMDDDFFWKMLKKLNKDINKYEHKYSFLNHPYRYEINDIINQYDKMDQNISHFVKVNSELHKPMDINKKVYKIIYNKIQLEKMVNIIKKDCDQVSLSIVVNYKNTYRGFTCLILIGTKDIDYIIDVLNMYEDMHILNEITTDSRILKILYKSENILSFLQKDFSVYFVNIVDIFVCSNYLNIKNSLPYLVHNYFHVSVNSAGQGTNLLKRPLSPDTVHNLRMHFHYLYYLFEYIKTDLYFNYIFSKYGGIDAEDTTEHINRANLDLQINQDEKDVQKEQLHLSETEERIVQTASIKQEESKGKRNIYVNFENIRFSGISEEEQKYGQEIIRTVFTDSNRICLLQYKIKEVCDVKKTKDQIKTIIKTSYYNYTSCDNLIENILTWREKLAKKNDESPDSIINIHTIISIILNMPTSISSLKNNIIPLSNIISENLEALFEIIIKSNIKKKKNLHFYQNYIQNEKSQPYDKNEEAEINSMKFPFLHEVENSISTYTSKDILIDPPKMHFQSISEGAQQEEILRPHRDDMHSSSNDGCNTNPKECNEAGENLTSNVDEVFTLERTFFSNDKNGESIKNEFRSHGSRDIKYEHYAQLSSLINYVKKRKWDVRKVFEESKQVEEVKKEDVDEIEKEKNIDKNTKRQLPENPAHRDANQKKIKQVKHKSYVQEYNIKNRKGIYSSNILTEMNKKWNN